MRPRTLLRNLILRQGNYRGLLLSQLMKLKPKQKQRYTYTHLLGGNPCNWEAKQVLAEKWVPNLVQYREFYAYFLRYYRRYTGKPEHLIDVGCGKYFWKLFAKALCGYYVGVDPIIVQPELGEGYMLLGDMGEAVIFLENLFDVATILSTLDHVRDENKALAETRRVLKDGGKLWVTQTVFKNMREVDGNYAAEHMRWFTRRTLLQLIGRYFTVCKVFRGLGKTLYVMAEKRGE